MAFQHRGGRRADIVLFIISLFCLAMIAAYGSGFFTAKHKIFPYYIISGVSRAVVEKYGLQLAQILFSKKHDKYPFIWFPTSEPASGVVIHERDRIVPGFTFFSDCTSSAYLIDMDGNVIHKWHKSFYDVWPRPIHVRPYLPAPYDDMIFWRKAHLFPDGSVVAVYEGAFAPYGAGIIKINAKSELVWKVPVNAHHSLDVDTGGRIWVLTHKYNDQVKRPRIDDYLTILSPEGELLREISLLQAIMDSPYRALIPVGFHGDYLHTNSVELLSEEKAGGFPFLNPGDILLVHLNISAITVLDRETFTVKWALTGPAAEIHDADFLMNGRIAFFDNQWRIDNRVVGSRIVEWDCINHKPVWEFTPIDYLAGIDPFFRETDIFFSATCGSQQKLPDGNYLITESNAGTLFEITRDKKVVWKYVHTQFDGRSIGGVYWARRFLREDLTFLDKN